jgi:hypothetical protein
MLPALALWGSSEIGDASVQAIVQTSVSMAAGSVGDPFLSSFMSSSLTIPPTGNHVADTPSDGQIKNATYSNKWIAALDTNGSVMTVCGVDLLLPDSARRSPALTDVSAFSAPWPSVSLATSALISVVPVIHAVSLRPPGIGSGREELSAAISSGGLGTVISLAAAPSVGACSLTIVDMFQGIGALPSGTEAFVMVVDAVMPYLLPSRGVITSPPLVTVPTGAFIVVPGGWFTVGKDWSVSNPASLEGGSSARLVNSQIGQTRYVSPIGSIPSQAIGLVVRAYATATALVTPDTTAYCTLEVW